MLSMRPTPSTKCVFVAPALCAATTLHSVTKDNVKSADTLTSAKDLVLLRDKVATKSDPIIVIGVVRPVEDRAASAYARLVDTTKVSFLEFLAQVESGDFEGSPLLEPQKKSFNYEVDLFIATHDLGSLFTMMAKSVIRPARHGDFSCYNLSEEEKSEARRVFDTDFVWLASLPTWSPRDEKFYTAYGFCAECARAAKEAEKAAKEVAEDKKKKEPTPKRVTKKRASKKK